MGLIVGIDASRLRSGGGIAHLRGFLQAADPLASGVGQVHVWAYKALLDKLPEKQWLVKHNPPALEKSLLAQVWWQFHALPEELRTAKCGILFTVDASTVCGFKPSVVLSQDMLSYEPGQMKRFGFSLARLRLFIIGILQTRALKRADGAVFLTEYAAKTIQRSTGGLENISVIPHGIDEAFIQTTPGGKWEQDRDTDINCLYISNAAMYKHQWEVIRAVGKLRANGCKLSLTLAGGGSGRAQKLIDEAIAETDPQREFITTLEFLPHDDIPGLLAGADIFIFASSCENMPVTLMEAMAAGLPIACSDRGPMPEVLEEGGVYFDPENSDSIAEALEKLILNRELRITLAKRAKDLSGQYTWEKCAEEIWTFLKKCAKLQTKA